MAVDVFVLSACSGNKAIEPPVVGCKDIDGSSRTDLLESHPDKSLPAKDLYVGNEHTHVKAAVGQLAEIATVDWRIISAGFGLVTPDTRLPSYECTFSDDDSIRNRTERFGCDPDSITKAEQRKVVAEELGIPTDVEHTLDNRYDLAFFLPGGNYLHAAGSSLFTIPDETTAFAFAPAGNRDLIGDCRWVPSTDIEREAHGTTWMQVKGRQLRSVVDSVTSAEALLSLDNPDTVRNLSLPDT